MADCAATGRSARVRELPATVAADSRQRDSSGSRRKTRRRAPSNGFLRDQEKNLMVGILPFSGLRYKANITPASRLTTRAVTARRGLRLTAELLTLILGSHVCDRELQQLNIAKTKLEQGQSRQQRSATPGGRRQLRGRASFRRRAQGEVPHVRLRSARSIGRSAGNQGRTACTDEGSWGRSAEVRGRVACGQSRSSQSRLQAVQFVVPPSGGGAYARRFCLPCCSSSFHFVPFLPHFVPFSFTSACPLFPSLPLVSVLFHRGEKACSFGERAPATCMPFVSRTVSSHLATLFRAIWKK